MFSQRGPRAGAVGQNRIVRMATTGHRNHAAAIDHPPSDAECIAA